MSNSNSKTQNKTFSGLQVTSLKRALSCMQKSMKHCLNQIWSRYIPPNLKESSQTNTLSIIHTHARLWSIFFLLYLQAIKRLGGQAMYQECLDLKVKSLDQNPIPGNIRGNLNNS